VKLLACVGLIAACAHEGPARSNAAGSAESIEKFAQTNHTGQPIAMERVTVPGQVTIVDFWSESCGACEVVGGMTAVAIARQPGIVVRKIDVGDGDTEVARQYQIGALPHYQVYDRHGKLRFDFVGNDCLKASTVAMQLLHEP